MTAIEALTVACVCAAVAVALGWLSDMSYEAKGTEAGATCGIMSVFSMIVAVLFAALAFWRAI